MLCSLQRPRGDNDHVVISYVAGAVAAGVDTDMGSLLEIQEPGQSQGAATVTVRDDGGLGLLEDVGETSTLQIQSIKGLKVLAQEMLNTAIEYENYTYTLLINCYSKR